MKLKKYDLKCGKFLSMKHKRKKILEQLGTGFLTAALPSIAFGGNPMENTIDSNDFLVEGQPEMNVTGTAKGVNITGLLKAISTLRMVITEYNHCLCCRLSRKIWLLPTNRLRKNYAGYIQQCGRCLKTN